MNTQIFVISHKEARVPQEPLYVPMQVGFAETDFPGYMRDNTGDNIAQKNQNFCELTALYWIWKNCDADVKGLVHYRRLLADAEKVHAQSIDQKYEQLLKQKTVEQLLQTNDIILPKAHHYYTETAKKHYTNNHYAEGLDKTEELIANMYPEYADTYRAALERKYSHLFNIMVAPKGIFDAYCEWMFSILFELEKVLDISHYSVYEARVFGFVSELLVDVYVEQNQLRFAERPVLYMEKQNQLKRYWNSLKGKMGVLHVE